jgi:hypothetical protein
MAQQDFPLMWTMHVPLLLAGLPGKRLLMQRLPPLSNASPTPMPTTLAKRSNNQSLSSISSVLDQTADAVLRFLCACESLQENVVFSHLFYMTEGKPA